MWESDGGQGPREEFWGDFFFMLLKFLHSLHMTILFCLTFCLYYGISSRVGNRSGKVRHPDRGPTEISGSGSCSDLEIYFKTRSGSGSFSSISIVSQAGIF